MSDIAVSHVDTDVIPEELAKVLQPTVLKWQAAAVRVAAAHDAQHQKEWANGSVEQLLSTRFVQIPELVQRRAGKKAVGILQTAPFRQRAQDALGIDITDTLVALPINPLPKTLSQTEVDNLVSFTRNILPEAPTSEPAGSSDHDKLRLQFTRVACVDETNGWFGTEHGSDEISIGGARFDTDGITAEIDPIDLGGDWDDGDVQDFNPPRSILAYSLKGNEKTFPRAVFATLVLVEKDGSGMEKLVDEVVKKIAAEVKTSLTALLAAAIGAGAGGPIGALIGLAVGYAVDKLVRWLASLWDDIAFDPKTIQVDIPSRRSTFNGSLTMPSSVVRFRGPGEYACRYRWVLS